jgi:hypothetical protein
MYHLHVHFYITTTHEQAAEKAAEKAAKDKIDPHEMFRTQSIEIDGAVVPKYSQYDDDGVPTHDANNAEVCDILEVCQYETYNMSSCC